MKKTVYQPKIKRAITCEFCEYAITFLDNQLKKDRTEEQIKAALEKLCSYLPSSVSGQVSVVLFICQHKASVDWYVGKIQNKELQKP